jgi:hypothetical protein
MTPTDANLGANNVPERFWDEAYDNLKKEQPALVRAYEKILTRNLANSNSDGTESQRNDIAQDNPDLRRDQMRRIIKAGLNKTEKEVRMKRHVGVAMESFRNIRDAIGPALQAFPQAGLPWALDECTNLPKLLEFVGRVLSASARLKILLASHASPDMEQKLGHSEEMTPLCL